MFDRHWDAVPRGAGRHRDVEVGSMSAYAGDTGHAGRASETSARLRGRLIAGLLAAVAVAVAVLALVQSDDRLAGRAAAARGGPLSRSSNACRCRFGRSSPPHREGAAGAYRVRAGADGSLQARGGGIVSSFSRGGVSLRGAHGRVSLALVGVSDAGAAVPIAQAPPRAEREPRRLRPRRRRASGTRTARTGSSRGSTSPAAGRAG